MVSLIQNSVPGSRHIAGLRDAGDLLLPAHSLLLTSHWVSVLWMSPAVGGGRPGRGRGPAPGGGGGGSAAQSNPPGSGVRQPIRPPGPCVFVAGERSVFSFPRHQRFCDNCNGRSDVSESSITGSTRSPFIPFSILPAVTGPTTFVPPRVVVSHPQDAAAPVLRRHPADGVARLIHHHPPPTLLPKLVGPTDRSMLPERNGDPRGHSTHGFSPDRCNHHELLICPAPSQFQSISLSHD